ncbi:TadE/TadG family type IV pilus assembly protein [Oceanisphaera sp. KMM 10153]|uniref:TadE/TadG family type IV pilus assembly protein n=1 Tax=Oceanisphaera submarina TaxID=3390193 RepID=UPI0039766055
MLHKCPPKKQSGAVAIEFAALFILFFTLLYAILAHSIPLLLEISFRQVSSEASRAVLRVDPAAPNYNTVLSREVTQEINNGWLPPSWRNGNCPAPATGHNWVPLPSDNGSPSYGHIADTEESRLLHVCLQRFYNAGGNEQQRAIIPIIEFAGIRIPSLPQDEGNTVIRGETITRL